MKKKDGSVMTCLASSTDFFAEDDGLSGNQVIIRDITEEKKVMERLTRTREELRYLSAHLQSLREIEHNTLAREIHDVLGQLLTALKIDCSWLVKKVPDDSREVSARKEAILNLLDEAIDEVGRISARLRPGLLYDLGLCEAMEWQAGEFTRRTGIECGLECDLDDGLLDRDQSIALFRIFQEALTNIARHAGATVVSVSLACRGDDVELRVADNGGGIPDERIRDIRSYGLIGMRERAYSCHGELSMTSSPERGTTIFVSIPLKAPGGMYI